jgi:hypothetical protein
VSPLRFAQNLTLSGFLFPANYSAHGSTFHFWLFEIQEFLENDEILKIKLKIIDQIRILPIKIVLQGICTNALKPNLGL